MSHRYTFVFVFLLEVIFLGGCLRSSPFADGRLNLYGYNIQQQTIFDQGNNIWPPNSFPIRVYIDSDIEESKKQEIISAIEQWNSIIGFDVFSWTTSNLENYIFYGQIREPERNNIYVLQTELGLDIDDREILGLTSNYVEPGRENYMRSSMVQFDEELAIDDLYYVALHEFGHVLGLKHDQNDISSLMYPYVLSSFGIIKPEDLLYIRNQR